MIAEIVSVGTELLLGQIADTDAQHLGQILPRYGIVHRNRQTVGDNLERLTEALRLALSRSDIVFTIGGLGPTDDDLTREGIAAALGEELVEDPEIVERLRAWFARRNYPWVESQRKQGMRPACARPIPNPNGTAPGLICQKDGKTIIAMPGPRGEFVPMADGPVAEFLGSLSGGEVIHSRVLRITGMGESVVEDRIRSLAQSANPTVAPYAHPGEVHLRLTAKASTVEEADALMDPLEAAIRAELGDAVFGTDDTTLEEATLAILVEKGMSVAVAESVTGGGLGERLTSVPGCSEAFVGGVIAYRPHIKEQWLGVDPEVLERETPVSAAVAEAMASGVRQRFGADFGVALTGNAGPTSDEGGKAVGLVYIAVAGPTGVRVEEHRFRGQREFIRRRSQQAALDLLWRIAVGV